MDNDYIDRLDAMMDEASEAGELGDLMNGILWAASVICCKTDDPFEALDVASDMIWRNFPSTTIH